MTAAGQTAPPRILTDDPALASAMSRSNLGDAPIGHRLRASAPDRWVRFHFFRSKRYPETAADDAAIYAKFQAIGDRLFSEAEVVKTCVWTVHQDDDDTDIYNVKTRTTHWSATAFQQRLLDTAHFETNSFTIISPDARMALSCYDGGFDVFAQDTAARDRLRTAFADWLSAHPDGL